MGKKRITNVAETTTKKAKKEIFRWEKAYADLSPRAAEALRTARLKPDQLTKMADGELLAVEGLDNTLLEEVRAHYPATIVNEEPKTETKKTKTKKEQTPQEETKPTTVSPRSRHPRVLHGRSSNYEAQKAKLKDQTYSITEAVRILPTITYSVHKTVELHLNTKDLGVRGEVSLPHSAGKETKIAIFSDELATKIKSGQIDFDILLAKPADMPKIAPLAKVLGPKGLMPNPKSNTIVDDPEKRKTDLEKGATLTYRTEAKAPLIHLNLGSLTQKESDLIDNLNAILTGIGAAKIKSAFLKTTMSPAIRLDLSIL